MISKNPPENKNLKYFHKSLAEEVVSDSYNETAEFSLEVDFFFFYLCITHERRLPETLCNEGRTKINK